MKYVVTYLKHHFVRDCETITETMTQLQLAELLQKGNITLKEVTQCL